MQKTKNDCAHKLNGESLLVVYGQVGNKYLIKCTSCQETFTVKKKQLPHGVRWDI